MKNKFNISFNIGYKSEFFHNGILISHPSNINCTIKQFSETIRKNINTFYSVAKSNFIPIGSLYLFVTITNNKRYTNDNPKNFSIKMFNVREYKDLYEKERIQKSIE